MTESIEQKFPSTHNDANGERCDSDVTKVGEGSFLCGECHAYLTKNRGDTKAEVMYPVSPMYMRH